MEWSAIGSPLTPETLAKVEAELGVTLPEDYRRFLLKTNGGCPMERAYIKPKRREADDLVIDHLYAVTEPEMRRTNGHPRQTVQAACRIYHDPEWGLPRFLLPIGEAHDLLLLSTATETFGHVYSVWTHNLTDIGWHADGTFAKAAKAAKSRKRVPTVTKFIESNYKIADSFDLFLKAVRPYEKGHGINAGTMKMLETIMSADVDAVRQLLDTGFDPHRKDRAFQSPSVPESNAFGLVKQQLWMISMQLQQTSGMQKPQNVESLRDYQSKFKTILEMFEEKR